MSGIKKNSALKTAILSGFFIAVSSAVLAQDLPPFAEPAVEHQNLYIDAATIEKGYTVEVNELRATAAKDGHTPSSASGESHPSQEGIEETPPRPSLSQGEGEAVFKVGVTPNSVLEPVYAVIKEIPASHIPVEKTEKAVSKIWEFDIRKVVASPLLTKGGNEGGSEINANDNNTSPQSSPYKGEETITETLGVLEKPIFVSIKHTSKNLKAKTIYFWNKPEQEWQPLPSRPDLENNLTRAIIHLPYARLAVFEEENSYEGVASWYSWKTGHFAAATIYPKGTKLRVTNMSGSSRDGLAVDIIVNDYGPEEWTGRLIDLEKHAYDHIGMLGGGVMAVRVELLELP